MVGKFFSSRSLRPLFLVCCLQLAACGFQGPAQVPEQAATPSISLDSLLGTYCPTLKLEGREELTEAVERSALVHGIEPGLVFAVITAESNCRRRARSRAGALGLMQLMPKTARWLGVRDPFSHSQNIDGGTKYLAHLLELFESDVPLALAAYNAGPTRVRRYGGIPPYRETRNYVRKVISYYEMYRIAR